MRWRRQTQRRRSGTLLAARAREALHRICVCRRACGEQCGDLIWSSRHIRSFARHPELLAAGALDARGPGQPRQHVLHELSRPATIHGPRLPRGAPRSEPARGAANGALCRVAGATHPSFCLAPSCTGPNAPSTPPKWGLDSHLSLVPDAAAYASWLRTRLGCAPLSRRMALEDDCRAHLLRAFAAGHLRPPTRWAASQLRCAPARRGERSAAAVLQRLLAERRR